MGVAHAAHVPGRVGPTKIALGHLLPWGFLATPSSRPKTYALIFSSPSEAAAAAKLLIPSEGDQILLLGSSGEGEIIVITSPPWRGRRPLHHHPHQDQHHLHHHLRDPLRSPRSLRVALP